MSTAIALNADPASGATSAKISITSYKVAPIAPSSSATGQKNRTVTMKGIYVSPSTREKVNLQLAIFGPIRTRSELANVLQNSNESRGTVYSEITTELTKITPFTKIPWVLSFDPTKYLGATSNGVYGFGVVESGTRVQENIPIPWFSQPRQVQPTKVVLLTQIAHLNTHLANGASQSLGADATSLDRINNLIDPEAQTNWTVDPATTQWIKELQSSALKNKATDVLTKLKTVSLVANPTIYSHANLKALLKVQPASVPAVIEASGISATTPGVYLPKDGEIGQQTLSALKQFSSVIPVIDNDFIYGGELDTSSAHVLINDTSVLVNDVGASNCFNRQTRFDIVTCLQATVAMMTAQSPSVSRTVLITAPTSWLAKPGDIKAVSQAVANQVWGRRIDISQALAAPAVRINRQLYSAELTGIDQSLIDSGNNLVAKARVLGTAFNSVEFTRTYVDVQLRSYSDLWPTRKSARRFISANDAGLEANRNQISIQSSNRVTIANPKTEVPVTVVNQSIYPLTVNIVLTSKSSSRFNAKTSEFVTIQPSQRVTVPIKIELTGTGSVEVTARLKNLDGQYLRITKTMQITSSAYQSIARTLVWGAFGLLVVLAILNGWRKRQKRVGALEETVARDPAEH